MTRSSKRSIRSEGRVRALLGYLALLLLPPLVGLLLVATKFQGLRSPVALDHSQLARHISGGDGFVTSVIRPLSLVAKADVIHHPDLYNAPGYPAILAFFFQLLHPGDRVAACAGLILWTLSIWLTVVLARIWFGPRVATLSALFWGCNLAGVTAAIEGLTAPLLAICVTLTFWLLIPRIREDSESADRTVPRWRIVATGLAAAVAFLSHYALVALALAVLVSLVASQKNRWQTLGLFALGFLLLALPWWIWTYREGSVVFGLFWYDLLTGTGSYPGDSVWRTMTLPPSPVVFFVSHPLEVARKCLVSLGSIRVEMFNILDPIVLFLFLAAVVTGARGSRKRHAARLVLFSLVLTVFVSCLLRPDPGLLLAWGPLLAILGAAHLEDWVQQRIGHVVLAGLSLPQTKSEIRRHESPRRILARVIPGPWNRLAVYLVVIALVAVPLCGYITVTRPGAPSQARGWTAGVGDVVRAKSIVMTDQPAAVAWYAKRRAVLLCQHENEFDQFERVLGPVDAILVTSAITQLPAQEQGDWWAWVATPRGIYCGLAPADQMPANAILRLRPKGSS